MSKLQLYADDTVIYSAGNNSEEATRKLQPSLNQFSIRCKDKKLSPNATKTKLVEFGNRQKIKKVKNTVVTIEKTPLQIVPTYKNLGITLDSILSYNYHVKSVAAMAAYKINL